MIISERIFKIMSDKGITQAELSEATGIAQSCISRWKTKKINPSAEKIMIICDALNVSPEDILVDSMTTNQKCKYVTEKIAKGKMTRNEAREMFGLAAVGEYDGE